MLFLHTSHKSEYLLQHLAMVVKQYPLSPFDTEVFLIQSQGMERWLSQQLANEFGVWANAQFLFPGKFFDEMARKIDASLKTETFAREQMIWRIESLLRKLSEDEVFLPLRGYLQGEQLATKRFLLAQQIAQSFDQYQLMRPELLDAWSQHQLATTEPSEVWQKALWQTLLEDLPVTERKHRGQLWQGAIDKMKQAPEGVFDQQLPKRISIFGVSTMPPIFLKFIQALATHTQVHLFLMQPCRHYWGDIKGLQETKREKYAPNAADWEGDVSHPLLSLLGQQGREFHKLLAEEGNADWSVDSFEDFSTKEKTTTLTGLQDGILEDKLTKLAPPTDGSIQIVSCHSPMREVQVLKDYLLDRLNGDKQLELRDILVMAPDISLYEAYISAVFEDSRFRYAIADRSLRSSNEILDALIELLGLLSSRFEWTRVLDLLEKPVVYQQLGLEEDALEWIRSWVSQTHIRWGKDGAHKKTLDLPDIEQNTWEAGLQQMMQGYTQRGTGIEIEGSIVQALGALDYFVREVLFAYSERLSDAKPASAWTEVLSDLLDTAFQENDFQQLAQLRQLIAELNRLPTDESYELAAIMQWLENSVGEQKTSQGFLAGQLTFCSMLPMRSIPFKVICILGLNEGDFPKIDRRPSFDLMGGMKNFKKGDRSSRRDDRYQFLDAILSARDALYLSYIGQSVYTNREIPPSVVVSELMECFEVTEDQPLVVKQALQAFSPRHFGDLFTYHAPSAETAQVFAQSDRLAPVWWQSNFALGVDSPTVIALSDVLTFFRDPQRYFVQNILGIRFDAVTAEDDTTELFELDHLQHYQVNQDLLTASLNGRLPAFTEALKTRGAWMQGTFGALALQQKLDENAPLVTVVENTLHEVGKKTSARFIELDVPLTPPNSQIQKVRLEGWTKGDYEEGNVFYRSAKLKAKDYLQAWIYHLLGTKTTYLIGLSDDGKQVKKLAFSPSLSEEQRLERLAQLLDVFIQGHSKPSDFWTEVTLTYYKAKADKKQQESAKAMDESIRGRVNHKNGKRYPVAQEIALLAQGREASDFLTPAFYQTAEVIFTPLFDQCEECSR